MKLIKKVTGIDISKDSIVVCFGVMHDDCSKKFSKSFTFSNDNKGFKKLIQSVNNIDVFRSEDNIKSVWFVLEATGVYYENLAYYLGENNFKVSVIVPTKTKSFMKTLENKSKTDKLDAVGLAQYGLEKDIKEWKAPSLVFKELKELAREYYNTKELRSQLKNKLHAKEYSHKPNDETVKRLKLQIKFFDKQIKEILQQIKNLIESDDDLNSRIKKVMTAKGIGLITVISIVAETNGFDLIENCKQLVSYAGLDIIHNQSGTITGKTRISKKGNKFIRNAVYMPALCAARFNENLKRVYKRLCISKSYKKIAVIAVARKLLILVYTLWKNNEEFRVKFN